MFPIPNTTTTATEQTVGAARFPSTDQGGLTPFTQGFLIVANNSAQVSILKGPTAGQAAWTPYALVSPTLIPLSTDRGGRRTPDFIFGVKAIDGVAGTHAQVFGALFQAGEAGLIPASQFTGSVSSSGGFIPGANSVNVQKNGALIGTEPTLDFEEAGGLLWTVTDDAPNTRVKISAKIYTSLFSGGPPAGAADGDVWIATAVDTGNLATTAGIRWMFAFNASSSKWEFIGGAPLYAIRTAGFVNTLTATWQKPGTAIVTVARAGDYNIRVNCIYRDSGAGNQFVDIGASVNGANPSGATSFAGFVNTSAGIAGNMYMESIRTGLAANSTIEVAVQSESFTGPTFSNMAVSVVPIRVT